MTQNSKKSSKTAVGGVITALSIVLMFLTSVIPTLTYALPAAAGFLITLIVIEIDKKWALGVYVAVSLLSVLLIADKEAAVMYIMFFGYYPIVKAIFEKHFHSMLLWVLKFAVFNVGAVAAGSACMPSGIRQNMGNLLSAFRLSLCFSWGCAFIWRRVETGGAKNAERKDKIYPQRNGIYRPAGCCDIDIVKTYSSSSFFYSILVSSLISILGLVFMDPLLHLLGSTSTILPFARQYVFWILISGPFLSVSCVLNNILRYEGHANFAMIGLTTGGILNIIGDPLFMFLLGMGVSGAGISTAISQFISFLILLSMYRKKEIVSSFHISAVSGSF